jgi:adenylyltransferase/sulfurtransferase
VISDEQLLRYSRQVMLPQMDVAGQERLLGSRVLVVGLGGLGCPAALYLAAAGIGELVLADGDSVELSNLQRQIAHTQADLGRAKVDSAADRIAALNPDTRVRRLERHLADQALLDEVAAVDLVIDASDRLSTRMAVNLACISRGKPLVSGAAVRSEGQVSVISVADGTPCYRCLYPEGSEDESVSCAENGVLAPIVGVIGALQALEAVKLLSGYGEPLLGYMLVVDGWSLQTSRVRLKTDPQCPHCGGSARPAGV